MKNIIYLFLLCSLTTTILNAQSTAIPDPNFEQALIDLGIDTTGNLNGSVFTYMISGVTSLNINNRGITDLTGIEDFTALETLVCNTNNLTNLDLSQNTALIEVFCTANNITNIDISNSPLLEVLSCNNNQLTSLDISNNPALINLDCNSNDINTLDVSNNVVLENLVCYNNNLTGLDVSNNTGLITLNNGFNQITGLNLINNSALTSLNCEYNQLTNLNLSSNIALESLTCNNNVLTDLDVSDNVALTAIHTQNNQLISLNVKNGNNSQINNASFNATNNPNLDCITVDDVSYSDSFWFQIDQQTVFSTNCDVTYVPDDNFEQALIDLGYDDVPDDYVVTANISGVTNLNVNALNISDLTGIEAFTALSVLRCRDNSIVNLDLSQNANLTSLYCYNNNLSGLNIKNGNNANVTTFNATNNPNLTCIEVDDVAYSTTNWTNIDSQSFFAEDCNVAFTYVPDDNFEQALIDLGYDNILDDYVITSNINTIASLVISNNNIADLTGIEDFTSLSNLVCSNNQITGLYVSQNTALTRLIFSNNQITSIDVSQNTNLVDFWGDNNQLSNLNTANGNNINFTSFVATNNPNLFCIEVDDVAYSTDNWLNIDAQVIFSEDCSAGITYIPDNNFEQALIDLGYDDVLNDYVVTANINGVTSLDVSGKNIADLTGIEDFSTLQILYVFNNQLTNLNLNQNTNLQTLHIYNNQINELDLSQNTTIEILFCNNNQLTSLNLKNDNNTIIQNSNFNATNNPNLTCIEVDDAAWSTTNWTNIDSQTSFSENCSLSVNDFNLTNVSIYPNPTKNSFKIETDLPVYKVNIFNNLGKQILKLNRQETYNISNLTSGIYFVIIEFNNKTIHKKLIIK